MSKKKFREIEFWIILEEFFVEGKRGRGKLTSLLFTNQEKFFDIELNYMYVVGSKYQKAKIVF